MYIKLPKGGSPMHDDLFTSLYDEYFDKIYQSTAFIVQNKSIAQEATQEAFIVVFKNMDDLPNIKCFQSWVAVIASRKAINMIKRETKITLIEDMNTLELLGNYELDPQEIIEKKLSQEELTVFIKKLSMPHREVIVLKYFYNLQEQEIAQILSTPLGTVKSRLSRAKLFLKQIIMLGNQKREGENYYETK